MLVRSLTFSQFWGQVEIATPWAGYSYLQKIAIYQDLMDQAQDQILVFDPRGTLSTYNPHKNLEELFEVYDFLEFLETTYSPEDRSKDPEFEKNLHEAFEINDFKLMGPYKDGSYLVKFP